MKIIYLFFLTLFLLSLQLNAQSHYDKRFRLSLIGGISTTPSQFNFNNGVNNITANSRLGGGISFKACKVIINGFGVGIYGNAQGYKFNRAALEQEAYNAYALGSSYYVSIQVPSEYSLGDVGLMVFKDFKISAFTLCPTIQFGFAQIGAPDAINARLKKKNDSYYKEYTRSVKQNESFDVPMFSFGSDIDIATTSWLYITFGVYYKMCRYQTEIQESSIEFMGATVKGDYYKSKYDYKELRVLLGLQVRLGCSK